IVFSSDVLLCDSPHRPFYPALSGRWEQRCPPSPVSYGRRRILKYARGGREAPLRESAGRALSDMRPANRDAGAGSLQLGEACLGGNPVSCQDEQHVVAWRSCIGVVRRGRRAAAGPRREGERDVPLAPVGAILDR